MIVPMKKVFLVVMEKERLTSLEKLREAGVLHLEKKSVTSGKLNDLLGKQIKNTQALGILRRYTAKKSLSIPSVHAIHENDLVTNTFKLENEKKLLHDELAYNIREKRRMEHWGDFDLDAFAFLLENKVVLIPYVFSTEYYNSLSPEIKRIVISRDKRSIRVLVINEPVPEKSPFMFSAQSLSQMDKRIKEIHLRIAEIETELTYLSRYKKNIEKENFQLQEEIDFETTNASMESCKELTAVTWLSGFIPEDKLESLKKAASEYNWALSWKDPDPEERPPTLVRNNAFIKIIQPLFTFLGTVPGYREYDISFSYLIFLCIFFAMIFGDAGYGVLLLIISIASGLLFMKKNNTANIAEKFPDVCKLFALLSLCTIIWGSITGSWFAIPQELFPPFLHSLIIPQFNNSGPLAEFPLFLYKLFKLPAEVPAGSLKTQWNIQFLCFTIGIIQLVWARGKNIIKLMPSMTALAQGGWLIMMVGLYFLVLFMLLKVALPSFAVWLIGIGLALYFIFAEQSGGSFFKNITKSFTNFLSIFLNAVGSFADIISYIRLFAVGLAGGIIAQSFNNMAIPSGGIKQSGLTFILRLSAGILILVFGHALNLMMNALSVIVHGVRLNLLEYAGNHLGMEWTGYTYKPFSIKRKS